MNRLLEVGFEHAGHWFIDVEKLNFQLSRFSSQRNILYAFICDGEIKYIGKTIGTLKKRMSGYKNPGKDQSTNINNHQRIKELISRNVAVEIFALPDNGLLHYGQFHLNLAAGLEDDIIRVIDPEWNGGLIEYQIGGLEKNVICDEQNRIELVDSTVGSFSFILQPTYYDRGFFNVGVSDQNLIGSDGEVIEIFLGDNVVPILGSINRRANLNNTPRIMGGKPLRDWFKLNLSQMSNIFVEVLSLNAIRLKIGSD